MSKRCLLGLLGANKAFCFVLSVVLISSIWGFSASAKGSQRLTAPVAHDARAGSGGGGGNYHGPSWKVDEVARLMLAQGYSAFVRYEKAVEAGYYPGRTSYKKVPPHDVFFYKGDDSHGYLRADGTPFVLGEDPSWDDFVDADEVSAFLSHYVRLSDGRSASIAFGDSSRRRLASKVELKVVIDKHSDETVSSMGITAHLKALALMKREMGQQLSHGGDILNATHLPRDRVFEEVQEAFIVDNSIPSLKHLIDAITKVYYRREGGRFERDTIKYIVTEYYKLPLKRLLRQARIAKLAYSALSRRYGEEHVVVTDESGQLRFRDSDGLREGETVVPSSRHLSLTEVRELARSSGVNYKRLRYLFLAYGYARWLGDR